MHSLSYFLVALFTAPRRSRGTGKTMVEFFSAAIVDKVCKYRSCRADLSDEHCFRFSMYRTLMNVDTA